MLSSTRRSAIGQLVAVIRARSVIPELVGNYPVAAPHMPEGYRWPLGLLYFTWAVCVALLYLMCR